MTLNIKSTVKIHNITVCSTEIKQMTRKSDITCLVSMSSFLIPFTSTSLKTLGSGFGSLRSQW